MDECRNFIAGEWVVGASTRPNVNPSDTNDVIGQYAQAEAAQTEPAIAEARAAFPAWRRSTPQQRFDVLRAEAMTQRVVSKQITQWPVNARIVVDTNVFGGARLAG